LLLAVARRWSLLLAGLGLRGWAFAAGFVWPTRCGAAWARERSETPDPPRYNAVKARFHSFWGLRGTVLELAFGGAPGTVVRTGAVVLERPVVRIAPGCASRFPGRWRTVPVLAGITAHRPASSRGTDRAAPDGRHAGGDNGTGEAPGSAGGAGCGRRERSAYITHRPRILPPGQPSSGAASTCRGS